ncbi:MAG TPA: hypothetical protein VFU81_17970 [Thermomicrobiales bacterium]|nr:hypothetical protein [Thermomicrobiales bacterium]
MDDGRFDHVARLLAGRLPRRAVGLGSIAAFGAGLLPANGEAKRRCRRRNQGCNRNGQCCTGVCGPLFEGPRPLGLCRSKQCGNAGHPCTSDADCCEVRCDNNICGT